MKTLKLFLMIFGLSISISSLNLKAQDTFKRSSFYMTYHVTGFPFFIDFGYLYRKNSSYLYIPHIGISYEYGSYSFGLFAYAGMEYRYDRFFINLKYKQGLIPYTDKYTFDTLESYGNFSTGYMFENVDLTYNLNVGKIFDLNSGVKKINNIFKIQQSVDVSALIYDNSINKLKLNTGIDFNIIPNGKEYSYGVYASIPYSFFHYWGELGIMPYISYSSYFNDSKKNYSIGKKYLNILQMLPLNNTEKYVEPYNFLTFLHLEYKLYMRFLPSGWNDLYLVGFGNVGYGKYEYQSINDGELLYIVGGGIGFNLFSTAPLQITLATDNNKSLIINIVISAISF